MDDVQISEETCPRCGSYMYWQDCTDIHCEDGIIDLYESDSDPLWYSPGDTEICRECGGKGFTEWCPACGYRLGQDDDDDDAREAVTNPA